MVYAKRPFGGAEHVVHYLGRYTHRVAISSHRLLSLEDHQVTFRWRDSRHHNKQRRMTLSVHEFLRRFLLHVLPIGSYASAISDCSPIDTEKSYCRSVGNCWRCRLRQSPYRPPSPECPLWSCPVCGGPMKVIERLTTSQIRLRAPPQEVRCT